MKYLNKKCMQCIVNNVQYITKCKPSDSEVAQNSCMLCMQYVTQVESI